MSENNKKTDINLEISDEDKKRFRENGGFWYKSEEIVNAIESFLHKEAAPSESSESVLSDFDKLWNMNLNEIWDIEDKTDFVIALNGYLCRKSNGGDNIGVLSEAERTVFVVISLEDEVNNGGFSQFFYNSSGNFANEAADRLRAIGAEKMALICEKAVAAVGVRLPEDRSQREDILDELPEEYEDILDECDSEFYDYPDKLSELIFAFAQNNREHFT